MMRGLVSSFSLRVISYYLLQPCSHSHPFSAAIQIDSLSLASLATIKHSQRSYFTLALMATPLDCPSKPVLRLQEAELATLSPPLCYLGLAAAREPPLISMAMASSYLCAPWPWQVGRLLAPSRHISGDAAQWKKMSKAMETSIRVIGGVEMTCSCLAHVTTYITVNVIC